MTLLLAQPDANMHLSEKQELVERALQGALRGAMQPLVQERARELEESHKRIRQAVSLRVRELQVEPQLPPDLLGILVLQPVVET